MVYTVSSERAVYGLHCVSFHLNFIFFERLMEITSEGAV